MTGAMSRGLKLQCVAISTFPSLSTVRSFLQNSVCATECDQYTTLVVVTVVAADDDDDEEDDDDVSDDAVCWTQMCN